MRFYCVSLQMLKKIANIACMKAANFTISLVLCTLFLCAGCSTREKSASIGGELARLHKMWIRFHYEGKHDSLILQTSPFFRKSCEVGDTLSAAYSGVQIAQSYLKLENKDSLLHYMRMSEEYVQKVEDLKVKAIFCNIQGGYYLKYKLDYPMALKYFIEGYKYSEEGDEQCHDNDAGQYRLYFLCAIRSKWSSVCYGGRGYCKEK